MNQLCRKLYIERNQKYGTFTSANFCCCNNCDYNYKLYKSPHELSKEKENKQRQLMNLEKQNYIKGCENEIALNKIYKNLNNFAEISQNDFHISHFYLMKCIFVLIYNAQKTEFCFISNFFYASNISLSWQSDVRSSIHLSVETWLWHPLTSDCYTRLHQAHVRFSWKRTKIESPIQDLGPNYIHMPITYSTCQILLAKLIFLCIVLHRAVL